MRTIRVVAAAITVLSGLVLAAGPAHAGSPAGSAVAPTAPYTALTVQHVTGGTSDAGTDQTFDPSNSTFGIGSYSNPLDINVSANGSGVGWDVYLAPASGTTLSTGTFPTVDTFNGSATYFTLNRQTFGLCSNSGTITISELTQDPTTSHITALALDYTLNCTDGSSYVGSFRYKSSIGYSGATVSPSSGDDGSQYVGTSLTHTVTLTNTGTSALTLGATTLTTATPAAYSMTNDGCSNATLPVAGTCQVTIAVNVSALGALSARLAFATNPTLPAMTLPFTVTGIRTAVVTATPSPGSIALSWTQLAGIGDPLYFQIYRGTSPTTLSLLNGFSDNGYRDSTVSPGVVYYYSVAEVTRAGTGPRTAPVAMETWPLGGAGAYRSQPPSRILDTRTLIGGHQAPLGAGQSVVVKPFGSLTKASEAVVVNLTVTGATTPTYLTVYAYGHSRPLTSSMSVTPGQDRANLVTIPVSSDGRFVIYNNAGSVNVIADLEGSYQSSSVSPTTFPTPGLYHPFEEPGRVFDSRLSKYGALPGGYYETLNLNGFGSFVMPHVTAVALNITAVDSSSRGYLTAWDPQLGSIPYASTLNYAGPAAIANMAIVQTNAIPQGNGTFTAPQIAIYNGSSTRVQFIVDIVGYFDDDYLQYGSRYIPVATTRLIDTRRGLGLAHPLNRDITRPVNPGSHANDWTTALDLNATVLQPTSATYLTLWPAGLPGVGRPIASSINAGAGQTISNHVIVGAGNNNEFNVYNNAGTTNLLADLVGRFDAYPYVVPQSAANQASTSSRSGPAAIPSHYQSVSGLTGAASPPRPA